MMDDECNCEFDPEEDGAGFNFKRVCPVTGKEWWTLHCVHDGYQNPCHHCGECHYDDRVAEA